MTQPAEREPASPGPSSSPARTGSRSAAQEDPYADIELIIEDARARAHQLIEESVAQAEELLRTRPHSTLDARELREAVERLRRTIADMAHDVRGLHRRLDSIEWLLRSRAGQRPDESAAPPEAATETGDRAAQIAHEEGQAQPAQAAPTAGSSPAPIVAFAPVPSRPVGTTDVRGPAEPPALQPERPAAPAAPALAAAAGSNTPARQEHQADAEARGFASNGSAPRGATAVEAFSPEGGSVLLRVSPIAGFQGLMRVQDALVRLPSVREANVEAYSQGEARLRLQLAQAVEPGAMAAEIGAGLGRPARLQSVAIPERIMQVALG